MERRMLSASVVTTKGRIARLQRARGFTLVELAVVVTIVAVLSVIAVVGYRRYMLNSKVTEAQSVVSGIKIAQEDYKSEKGQYANLGTTYCPTNTLSDTTDKKWAWNPGCSGGKAAWNTIAVHVEGPVQFQYLTVADSGTFTAPSDATWVTWNTPTTIPNWYVVVARADLSAGGTYTTLVGSSFDNRIFSQNVGE